MRNEQPNSDIVKITAIDRVPASISFLLKKVAEIAKLGTRGKE